jgi:superfamily II DNA helicase RecQ
VFVPEVAVLADEALRAVARRRPLSTDELAAIPGVGPARADRLGPSLLTVLHGAASRPR